MKIILNIWMQPLYARMNVDSKKTLLMALLFVPAVAQLIAAILYVSRPDKVDANIFLYSLLIGIAANIAILCFMWFVSLVQNVGLQFSPANAGLLPRQDFYLKIALALPVMFFATITALLSFLFEKQFSIWPTFITVTLMMFLILIVRSQWLVLPMILFFQAPVYLRRAGYKDTEDLIVREFAWSASITLLIASALLIIGGVHWVFSKRNDSLFDRHKKLLAYRASLLGQGMADNRFTLSFSTLFFGWMSFSIRHARKQLSPDKSKLLGFLFGPKLHWTTIFFQMISMALGGVLVVSLLEFFSVRQSKDFLMGFGVGFVSVLILSIPLFFCLMLFYSLYQTRGEQGLLSLTPGTGNAKQRDRSIVAFFLRQFAIMYSISVFTALMILMYVDLSETKQLALVLFITCLFPLILNLATPVAKMKNANDHPLLKNLLFCVALFVLGVVLVLIVNTAWIWIYAPLIFIGTTYVLWKRLRGHLQTNVFPVGRAV